MSTGGSALAAKSAEGPASVSTGGSALAAKSAEGKASVNTGGSALTAKIVQEPTLATKSQGVAKWSLSQRKGANSQYATQMGQPHNLVCHH